MKRTLIVVVYVLGIALSACGGSADETIDEDDDQNSSAVTATTSQSEEQSTPTESSVVEPTAVEPTAQPEETEAVPTEVAASPTSPPQPTATEVPAVTQEDITIVSQGFGQPEGEEELGWAVVLENPNVSQAIENSQYQVAMMDAAGTVLETDSGYINLILPDERLGLSGVIYLPDGSAAATMDVTFEWGEAVASDVSDSFGTSQVTYFADEFSSKVSGVITNPYTTDLEDLRVSAVALDTAGEIIGGGFAYLGFVPASGQTGVQVLVTTSAEPATVELFASISSLTTMAEDADQATDASALILGGQGFGQDIDFGGVGWAFLVENPNPDMGVELSRYQVSAYNDAGVVIGVDNEYMSLLLPAEKTGMSGTLYVPEQAVVARLDVQLLAGDFNAMDAAPLFATESVAFIADDFLPKVTGIVKNLTDVTLENLRTSAIAYNDAGEIIGGGYSFLESVPGQGQAAADVSVTTTGVPARVELYPAVSGLTDLSP